MMNETNGTQHGGLQRNPSGSELKLKPLLLGNGRLAKHLHHYFHLLDLPHSHFENARDLDSAELHRKLENVNAIWILTSDRSIADVKNKLESEIAGFANKQSHFTWIHSSAATEVEGMITLHPLMTFGHEFYSLEQYERIPFAVIDNGTEIRDMLPFSNPTFPIASEQRALYHAFAVMMSNLPVILWSLASENSNRELGLSPDVYAPILKQTLDNFLSQGAKALTGPIARGDQTTIDKNLTALRGVDQTQLAQIYESFLIQKGATS